MISKELKRLSRRELVDIIYQLKKNEQELQEQINSLQNELQDKRIRVEEAGSLAEASMSITNVFATAQMTADVYLREIDGMKQDAERECADRIAQAKKKVKEALAQGQKQYDALRERYRAEYQKYQQLRADIQQLEHIKTHETCEDTEND